MDKLSPFQLTLLTVFGVAALVGVGLFAMGVGPGEKNAVGPVMIWGTLPQDAMEAVLVSLGDEDDRFNEVSYVEKDPRTYNRDFVDALASGQSPDLFLLSEEDIYMHKDKILFIPFSAYSERQFKDVFAQAGELYLAPSTGIAGLPLIINPLVLYWNKDIFADAGVALPPRYWDEFFTNIVPRITERDQASNIVRSFIAFGEYRNVNHAKDILATLILQAGNPIVLKTDTGQVRSVLGNTLDQSMSPGETALRFYTQFSNPANAVYSWNRALPDARQSFLAGDLALYFGFANEYKGLRNANPNLNFDVVSMPQPRGADHRVTLGHVLSVAMPRGAMNPTGALTTAIALASVTHVKELATFLGLPPARRDLLNQEPQDPSQVVFYDAAISARSWLDPNSVETEGVFQRMIESLLSGRLRINEAVQTANKELEQLLLK